MRVLMLGLEKMKPDVDNVPEYKEAMLRVFRFLQREWLNMSVGGPNGTSLFIPQDPNFGWTMDQIKHISQRLRISVSELLGSPDVKAKKGSIEVQRKHQQERLRMTERWRKQVPANIASTQKVIQKGTLPSQIDFPVSSLRDEPQGISQPNTSQHEANTHHEENVQQYIPRGQNPRSLLASFRAPRFQFDPHTDGGEAR